MSGSKKEVDDFRKLWDKGLAVHAEHPNETTLRCLGIRMEFEQIYNTNPQLAHMVMQNPKVKEAQKFLQEAVKEMEQDSPEKKSK